MYKMYGKSFNSTTHTNTHTYANIQTSNLYNNKYHKAKSCVTSQHAGDKDKRLHT